MLRHAGRGFAPLTWVSAADILKQVAGNAGHAAKVAVRSKRAPAKARHSRGGSPRRARALGLVTESNCVAARRGGEQLEVNPRSATKVNPIRPTGAASLRLVVKPGTERELVAPRAQRRRRGRGEWLGAERREGGAREAGRPDRGSVFGRKVTRSGVRAPIRAMKRRNGRGAKGGREVEP